VNPLENMFYAITRRSIDGAGEAFHPDQSLTIDEAIEAYTRNPAHATGEGHQRGTLVSGFFADLVVLSHDIRHLPPERLLDTAVVLTMVDGRIVHDTIHDGAS
jgi:hypothetical protein